MNLSPIPSTKSGENDMKLLSRDSNTKLIKTAKGESQPVVLAGLSMMPSIELCPMSKAAECFDDCLKSSGLAGVYSSVNIARQRKTDYYMADREGFLSDLRRELTNLVKYAKKHGKQAIVRLNVLSDVEWEKHNIPQEFPEIKFYDYTKRARRLVKPLPENYGLMFSFSNAPKYRKQVEIALQTDAPITVVFKNGLPETYMGREVIDGDKSDLDNLEAKGKIVGLRVKGNEAKHSDSPFIVDANVIPTLEVAA
tara:strand:- start:462 stop:1220 length:759 start_codon:yes stop_codon:yes gene_type:complete